MEVNVVENKPNHYDGSLHSNDGSEAEMIIEPFTLTDEVREKISCNPYFIEIGE
jgi:hypothetical protein